MFRTVVCLFFFLFIKNFQPFRIDPRGFFFLRIEFTPLANENFSSSFPLERMLEIFLKNVGQQLAGQQELEEIFFFVFRYFANAPNELNELKEENLL